MFISWCWLCCCVQVWVICPTSDKRVKVEHIISKRAHEPITLRFWVRVWCLSCLCGCSSLDIDGPPKLSWMTQQIVPTKKNYLFIFTNNAKKKRNNPNIITMTDIFLMVPWCCKENLILEWYKCFPKPLPGAGSQTPEAASQVRFLAFSSFFWSFFHLKTLRNLKSIFFTLYCLQQSFKNPWSSIFHPWSFTWCLDLMIYMIPHYKTLKTGVAWSWIKLNYNDSIENNTICS